MGRIFIPPPNKAGGGYTRFTLFVCLSVCLSFCLAGCPSVCHFQNGGLAAMLDFAVSRFCSWCGFQGKTLVYFWISVLDFTCMLFVAMRRSILIFSGHFQNGRLVAILDFSVFGLLTSVWLWISSPNFSSTLLVCMVRRRLIFRDVTFKMDAWRPYWIFGFEYQIWTSVAHYLRAWIKNNWFSAVLLSKWPPGGDIGFFCFCTLTLVWL